MPPVIADPVHAIEALLGSRSETRLLIALAGLPGSGKSTIARKLAAEVDRRCGPGTMLSLGMDGFHLTKAELKTFPDPEAALARRGAPWTFDPAALAQRLARLRANNDADGVPWPGFEHEIGDPVEAAVIVPQSTRVILVEGLYLLMRENGWESVSAQFDLRWFLEVPLPVALERLTSRHMAAWNMTRAQAEARIAKNDALNAELVAATRPLADGLLADSAL